MFGAGYNEHKANLMMELMIKSESEKNNALFEYGAFVYQGEDGLYYISNVLQSQEPTLKAITDGQFNAERELLGLAVGTEASFAHSHLISDAKNDNPSPSLSEYETIKLMYGSKEDADTVEKGSLGNLKIKTYTIYAPIKQKGWSAEDIKVTGWNEERWPKE